MPHRLTLWQQAENLPAPLVRQGLGGDNQVILVASGGISGTLPGVKTLVDLWSKGRRLMRWTLQRSLQPAN